MIHSTTESIAAPDGTTLLTRHWAAGDPWAAMLLIHGLGEHTGRYEQTGSDFAEAGIDVSSFDQRGFGASGGHRAYVDSFDDYLDDLEDRLGEVRARGLPTVLLGHSLGGLISFAAAISNRPQPDLLVLSAPALDADVPGGKKLAAKALSRILPKLAMRNDIKGEQLSRDEAVGRAYFADPLVYTKTTTRLGDQIFRTMDTAQARLAATDLPTFVIHGGADTIVPPTVSAPLGELPNVDRTLFEKFRHESFNEIDREDAVTAVIDWIRTRVEAGSPTPLDGDDQPDAGA